MLRFKAQPCLQPGNSRENKGGNYGHTAPWAGWSSTSVILTGEESWTGCGRGMGRTGGHGRLREVTYNRYLTL